MTFEQIIETTKCTYSEDGFELEKEFDFWKQYKRKKLKQKSITTTIPVLCSFVNEEKEIRINEKMVQNVLVPNRDIILPTVEQKNAILYLFENESLIGEAVVDYIFNEYNKLREYYEEPDDSDFMPKLNSGAELTDQIELTQVYILSNSNKGISFTGFYFSCAWDEDHGIGLLAHKDQVLQFGQLEQACDEYFKIQ